VKGDIVIFVNLIGRLSHVFGIVAMIQIAFLTLAMVYEVVCRFGFNTPNIWAFDIAYMFAGTLFFVGAAYTLRENAHVRIDFLSSRFPAKVEFWIHTLFMGILLLPILGVITAGVAGKAWNAFVTQQTDYTSPWAPLMWPFYSGIGVGLVMLWLLALAGLVERIVLRCRGSDAVAGPSGITVDQT